jgi:hypothetical protein
LGIGRLTVASLSTRHQGGRTRPALQRGDERHFLVGDVLEPNHAAVALSRAIVFLDGQQHEPVATVAGDGYRLSQGPIRQEPFVIAMAPTATLSFEMRDRPISEKRVAEKLIGSIRPECLDDVVIFGERDLRRPLEVSVEPDRWQGLKNGVVAVKISGCLTFRTFEQP